MANKKISQLTEYVGNPASNDTFVFVQTSTLSTYKVTYANMLSATSLNTNSTFTTLNSNSSKWESTYSTVNSNSANGNSVYSSVNPNSASWNSVYSTTNTNSAFWSNYVNYLSTNNVLLNAATVIDGLSAASLRTEVLSSRTITLVHTPANDGTNPTITIGETTAATGFSGFNIFYDELQNQLTVTSVFSGVTGAAMTIDRFGNAAGPMFPYTVTLSKFFSAAGTKTGFFPAALSGMIPGSEITSRVREGKGMIRGSFIFAVSGSNVPTNTENVRLEFATNPAFTNSVSIFSNTMGTNNPGNILKVVEGYVLDNSFVFPGNTANPYSANNGLIITFSPYNSDLYFRAGFNVLNPTSNVWLSGGSISIIP